MAKLTDQSLPRRSFLRGHFLSTLKTKQATLQGHNAVRPPWVNLANFLTKCTACDNCITICETQIIVRGAGGYPEVDFSKGECTFCEKCVQSCQAGVFLATSEVAWQHKVAVQECCLLQHRIACRSCGDSCESRAIRFRPKLGGIAELQLDLTACNGCGACLSVCPANAITLMMEH
ncbi:ferredoxin-type protein NapF [[Haemophilus] ducreyi]|uniref:Ferredoxin-type protein NapF n=2 Tax=Haemophilus ducreyi TaxID=730 RepID=Q7VPJ9_HAEDU|nr:ferredoxin-type protein NapF [[Haemophilus] ducreyi]AAP95082.1 ferredoxin-type protein NapF [[Haemophilus] ducreyi 35000HP]AKO30264.1 ferredoxin [[Haemophilus] ducreyi]AKO31697.1 ferredoxin [[Haemophilus] ducreyi]AKO33150.1 ferredoxin [[Haemophilus] ducreyi]AKO34599.1 ferredoxin [[Haemophilus] ducreyi]